MIHLDYTDEGHSVASLPTVCMHCEDPVAPCAEAMVVPAERVQWPVPGGLPVVEINGKDVRR